MLTYSSEAPAESVGGDLTSISEWRASTHAPAFTAPDLAAVLPQCREPLYVLAGPSGVGLALAGSTAGPGQGTHRLLGVLPALYPEWLGDRSFCTTHHVRFPYVAGEMANGIATTRMVVAMARAEMLGFFGAGGLGFGAVERAVDELVAELGSHTNWGVNLIHSPNEPQLEERVADLLLRRGVPKICASAFMGLTPAVVRCAATGLTLGEDGTVQRRTSLFAKVSRPEVAERFMSPPPADMLEALVGRGLITREEATLAARIPVAEDITVEGDSGGHTDNRPLVSLLPTVLALRDVCVQKFGYTRPIRVGAAGGLGTPEGVAAAFALGAAYVVTGSVNQVAIESGLSEDAKAMLAQADVADVVMAPAADMFELGVKLQVLRRGTMFAGRAQLLYDVYRSCDSIETIPAETRIRLERDVFRAPLDEIWCETAGFWQQRDPDELVKAAADPKHRMALLFRWYLGKSSRWAIEGDTSRRTDYQIWCGPALGAFNRWTQGTFLAAPTHRTVVQIALNLLEGATVLTRAHQARTYGVAVPALSFTPRPLS